MTAFPGRLGTCALLGLALTACGGGSDTGEKPLNVDYSGLRIAESRDTPLVYARTDEEMLAPMRNGMRVLLSSGTDAMPAGSVTPAVTSQGPQSDTTVQVQGVDEGDSVKYDGRYVFAARRETVPATPAVPVLSRNVLDISRTDPATAGVTPVAKYVFEGEQSTAPILYQVRDSAGLAEYQVAISQNYYAWLLPAQPAISLVLHPDRTTIQLLDVRDPQNIAQTWKVEMDGWLRASRMIGDTLYLVTSYRPRLPDLVYPADTMERRIANEQRIRRSSVAELLPSYAENGGARQRLVRAEGCLVPQGLGSNEGYLDLTVVIAIDVRARRLTDVNCLSTNVNSVYVSRESVYVAGTTAGSTVFHKFALDGREITYRATGSVTGHIGWSNPSYFMDEHNGDLRVLTSVNNVHRLTVLRESSGQHLLMVSSLPNAARPEPIGKPGEAVYAVRFVKERAYVVTFRVTDPLYVIDLSNPADPSIVGQLVVPGISTYLRQVGAADSPLLLAIGENVAANGRRGGIKVELFDVRDITHPQSLGAEVLGTSPTSTEALYDPHALTCLDMPNNRYRLALPVRVYDTSNHWAYSGLHLFEVAADTPALHFQGVIKTAEPGGTMTNPPYGAPERGVLHGESAYAIQGERIRASLWGNVTSP